MENLSTNNILTQVFKVEFPDIVVTTDSIEIGKGLIHAVFVEIYTEDYLKENWVAITNTIALHFQSKFEGDFERWNLYLFFLLPKNIILRDELKYKIENDTFSSRKIVEDISLSTDALFKKHINNQLSIEGLKLQSDSSDFEYNPIIWDILKDKTIKKAIIIHEEQMKTYEELLNKLKKANEI
jgi:hypothetical protein